MSEYVGEKPLFDKYMDLKAENERLRKLVAELPKCVSCGGIIKPEQGGQCMPCADEIERLRRELAAMKVAYDAASQGAQEWMQRALIAESTARRNAVSAPVEMRGPVVSTERLAEVGTNGQEG